MPRPTQADIRQDAKLNLAEILKQFVGATAAPRENPELNTLSAGVAQRVFRNRPNRFAALIINTSLANMWWGLTANVAVNLGFWLPPQGGGLILDWREDFELVGWEQFLIQDGLLGATIYSLEIVSE